MPTQWKGKLLSMESVPDLEGLMDEIGILALLRLAEQKGMDLAADYIEKKLQEQEWTLLALMI